MTYIIALQGTFPSQDSGSNPTLGEVSMFAGNFAPQGWAKCEGQLLSIASNTALFSIMGTTYGGDGETTFALPDLRGRTPIGTGNGPGLTPRSLGARSGSPTTILNTNQIPNHLHSLPNTAPDTGSTGGGQQHSNMQPWLAISYVVPWTGIYPSQSLGGDSYLASVEMFAGNFAPYSTIPADGRLLSIAQNSALFSLVGTIYGGDGETTFGVPDLRGRAAVHSGYTAGPGLTRYNLGQKTGVENVTLSTAQMPSHTHDLPGAVGATGSLGGNQAYTNRQPGLGLNYVIAMSGLYPSQSFGGSEPFLGEIGIFAGNFAPRGWSFCDGQLLPIHSYQALFSIMGTTYGGDGETTFALPDLRGRSAIGAGTGPGLPTYHLGQKVGNENTTLTTQQMAAHTHTLPDNTWAGRDGWEWHIDSDWSLGQSPVASHNAYLNNGNAAVVTRSGHQCASLFLGRNIGDTGVLEIAQGGFLSAGGGAYVGGFGGMGELNVASGGQISSGAMSIGGGSVLRVHVSGDGTVVLGSAGFQGSMTHSGSIGLYADAFLAGGPFAPISDSSGGPVLWSGSGTLDTFGGAWDAGLQTFTLSSVIPLADGEVQAVVSNDRLLITDASSGKQVSVSFGDLAAPADFSATPIGNADLLNLEALLPADVVVLDAWDFDTTLPDGTGAFLAFDVGSGITNFFQVWHLDQGVWSLYDPAFKSADLAGGIAGFTVDGFSGYAVTVPEPGTLALLSLGALGALRRRRRR